MTARLTEIWRYPIKGIGSEQLDEISLRAQAPLPGDRAWAVLHEGGADHDDWQPRRNFLVVASGPMLAAVTAQSHDDGRMSLKHPDRPEARFDLVTDGAALIDWARPLWPEQHSAPTRLVSAPPEGMADNGVAQVSIMNHSSLRALSQKTGMDLDPKRFRGNLWLDGLAPWEEFDLVGKSVQIGDVRFDVTDRIERCRATEANPDTGRRDVDPLRALTEGWGHRDFGVYATVSTDGRIARGDPVTF